MKIGIDLDEVVCEFTKRYLEFFNAKFGTNVKYEDIKSWEMYKDLNVTSEEHKLTVGEFNKLKKHLFLELVEGAREAIVSLAKEHQIFFITARPLEVKEETEEYLRKHFPGIRYEIYFSGDHWPNKTRKKHEICMDLGLDVIIDDNPTFLMKCADENVKCLLFNCAWNRDKEAGKATRVNNWKEAMQEIARMKK